MDLLNALSDYLLAGEALLGKIRDDLLFAGVAISDSRALGADYWPVFLEAVRTMLDALENGGRAASSRRFPVTGGLSARDALEEDRAER